MPAHVEAEHEVRVPELGAHAPDARKLLHGRKFGCHFMNGIFNSGGKEPLKNVTCHSEDSMFTRKSETKNNYNTITVL